MVTKYLQRIMMISMAFAMIGSPASWAQEGDSFEAQLRKELNQDPDDVKVRKRLGHVLTNKKDYKGVIKILSPYADELQTPSLLRLSGAFRELGKIHNEVKILEIIAKQNKKSYEPLLLLGNAHLELRLKPPSNRALRKSELKANQKLTDKAISYYRKAIKAAPKNRAPYDALLNHFTETKGHYEAQTLLTTMIKRFGKKGEFYSHLCRLYSLQAFIEQALETCQRAIKKEPQVPDNYVYLANTFYDQKKLAKTMKVLKTAYKKFPKSYDINVSLAKNYQEKNNHHATARYYRNAVKIKPKSFESNIGLAESLFKIGSYEPALTFFEKACQLQRGAKRRLRVALATLKKENNYDWVSKYNDKVLSCP